MGGKSAFPQEPTKAKSPKTRYSGGHMARPIMILRKWGGDKLYDTLITKIVK